MTEGGNAMPYQIDIGVFSLVFIVLGWLVKAFMDDKDARINLERRISSMETKIEPLWNIICERIPKIVNVSNSPNLLEKLKDRSLTKPEMQILEAKLKQRIADIEESGKSPIKEMMALWMVEVYKREEGWI